MIKNLLRRKKKKRKKALWKMGKKKNYISSQKRKVIGKAVNLIELTI